jgi:hypothetical protein
MNPSGLTFAAPCRSRSEADDVGLTVAVPSDLLPSHIEPPLTFAVVGAIEAENLVSSAKTTNGTATAQPLDDGDHGTIWSNGQLLVWDPSGKGAEMTLQFPCPAGGKVEIVARLACGPDLGTVQFAIDGNTAGDPIDLFDSKFIAREVSLGTFTVTPGITPLVVRITGKNALSKGFAVGIDAFILKSPR